VNGSVLADAALAGQSSLGMDGESEALPRNPAAGLIARRSERKLIRAAQGGSEAAMEELFRLHWPRAQRAAFLVVRDRAAAEDIAQEAFLSALRALERFDRRRPFGPWLHRIVVNRAIDHARSRKLRREVEPEPELADERPPATDSGGLSDELIAGLRTLSPEHRAVIVLRYLLDFTPGEIAEALEMPRGTVNSRLRRGLDRLSLVLEEER
jgi:RNA polymerase sigma-70 factor (ECF subfamily)